MKSALRPVVLLVALLGLGIAMPAAAHRAKQARSTKKLCKRIKNKKQRAGCLACLKKHPRRGHYHRFAKTAKRRCHRKSWRPKKKGTKATHTHGKYTHKHKRTRKPAAKRTHKPAK